MTPIFIAIDYDIVIWILCLLLLFGVIISHYFFSKKEKYCLSLNNNNSKNLAYWRYSLYLFSFSFFFYFFTLLSYSSDFRILFYLLSFLFIVILLDISLPSWFCKKNMILTNCNCDYYNYKDFSVVVIFSMVGVFCLFIFSINKLNFLSFLFLFFYNFALISIYLFFPKKVEASFSFPSDLVLKSIDDLQNFLITNINKRKIIFLVKSGCDFCQLQLNELNLLTPEERKFVKIINFSTPVMIDSFVLEFLNITMDRNIINFPTGIIIENGINSDVKEGVISSIELNYMLDNF